MDILGVGVPELILVCLIIVIVAGPRRAVRWAYALGRETAKLRRMWEETKKMIQEEMRTAGLEEEYKTLQEVGREVSRDLQRVSSPVRAAEQEARKALAVTAGDGKASALPAQAGTPPSPAATPAPVSAPPSEAQAFKTEAPNDNGNTTPTDSPPATE